MKFTIAPQTLLEGLNIVAGAAALRTPKPALQGVKISALADTVILMATDLDVGVRYKLTQVEIEQEGEALVPVAKLSQIIRESFDATITLELEEKALHIRGSDSHFSMFTSDPQEFPPVPELEGKPDFVLSGAQLKRLIDRTLFAAARESTRYAIDGLLWDRQGDQLRVVATDGRRLAVADATVQDPADSKGQKAIIPAKAMNLVSRVATDPEELLEIKFLSNQVLFKSPRFSISSVLVEGHFPKYQDVIPRDQDRTVEISVPEMLSAVRRSALLTSEESRAIRLRFADNKVVMTGRAPEQGQSSVELHLAYDAEPLEIGFNPNFLVDFLKTVTTEKVKLELKDANRPGLFRNGEDYLYVVMPVNLS